MKLKIIYCFNQFVDIEKIGNRNHISVWMSKCLFDESIKHPNTFN